MTFIANPAAPPTAAVDESVAGDGWFPALTTAAFAESMRIPAAVAPRRLREALLGGMLWAAVQLADWRAAREAEGIDALEAIAQPSIGGEPRALVLWRRAVFAHGAAELVETHGEINATEAGRDRREMRAAGADELHRTATHAIRDLLGRRRNRSSLV